MNIPFNFLKKQYKFVENDLFLYCLRTNENFLNMQNLNPYVLYVAIEKIINLKCLILNKYGIFEETENYSEDPEAIYCYLITTKEFTQEKEIVKEFVIFYKITKSGPPKRRINCYLKEITNPEINISALSFDQILRLKKDLHRIVKTEDFSIKCKKKRKKIKQDSSGTVLTLLLVGIIVIVAVKYLYRE
jgi:hypothetical protein